MLKELFVVAESGTIVYYKNYIDNKIEEFHDPTLISAFITAIQGFSNETFHSRFKGMELENQTLFVIFNQAYFIGVFSYDELEAGAFRLLNKIAIEFNSKYSEDDYFGRQIDLTEELKEVINSTTINKFKPYNILVAFFLIILATLLYFPIFNQIKMDLNADFYVWVVFLLLASIICSRLVPQRWIALITACIFSFIPTFFIFFVVKSNERFVFADYSAAIVILPWLIGAYIFERRYVHTGIIPKIPIISSIF